MKQTHDHAKHNLDSTYTQTHTHTDRQHLGTHIQTGLTNSTTLHLHVVTYTYITYSLIYLLTYLIIYVYETDT